MVALAAAEDLAETSGKSFDEGRRRKRFYKFLFKAIGPIMSTLTTVVLVKAKIVLVALFFAGIYFFGHKIFPGGFFGSSIVSETPPPYIDSSPYTSYHSDHEIISSYPGPEPFSSYGPPSHSSSASPSLSYLPPASGSDYSSYSKRDIFHNYRDASDERATSYKDCGRIYEECQVPKRKKYARRPFGQVPLRARPVPVPDAVGSASYDTQENEIESDTETTTDTFLVFFFFTPSMLDASASMSRVSMYPASFFRSFPDALLLLSSPPATEPTFAHSRPSSSKASSCLKNTNPMIAISTIADRELWLRSPSVVRSSGANCSSA
uniref:Uncharacterized protein n=1 Tax=Anopheles atroparvus TaxID=41427 RepID=A0A182JBN5_ANOAO